MNLSLRHLLPQVGCGDGELALSLSQYFASVLGVDIDSKHIQEASMEARRRWADNFLMHIFASDLLYSSAAGVSQMSRLNSTMQLKWAVSYIYTNSTLSWRRILYNSLKRLVEVPRKEVNHRLL